MTLSWLPNGLCFLRMLLAPPTAWLLMQAEYWLTLLVFFIAAVTDAADGYLAKRFHWESELGKALDPLADKLLLITVFVTLAILGLIPVWLATLVVLRDVVITSGAIAYRLLHGPLLDAAPTVISKLNTLLQILYVFAVVFTAAMSWQLPVVLSAMAWLVLASTLSSGVDYVLTYSRRAAVASRAKRDRCDGN
ncbi:MAG: CDP-alcohol phosphatidyltransferase family protein [Steroidobacteraceae bacterium]